MTEFPRQPSGPSGDHPPGREFSSDNVRQQLSFEGGVIGGIGARRILKINKSWPFLHDFGSVPGSRIIGQHWRHRAGLW